MVLSIKLVQPIRGHLQLPNTNLIYRGINSKGSIGISCAPKFTNIPRLYELCSYRCRFPGVGIKTRDTWQPMYQRCSISFIPQFRLGMPYRQYGCVQHLHLPSSELGSSSRKRYRDTGSPTQYAS